MNRHYLNAIVSLVALFGWFALLAVVTGQQVIEALRAVGWHDFLGSTESGFSFALACLSEGACREAIGPTVAGTPPALWMWLPAGVLLFVGLQQLRRGIHMPQPKQIGTGGARWAEKEDLGQYLRPGGMGPLRGYLGVLPESGKELRCPEKLRCSHSLVLGGPGARKSTGYHKPNMIRDAEDGVSAIVFDLKYPDPQGGFFDMAPLFARAGHDVQLFLPYGKHSLRLPLLRTIASSQDARDIASLIVPFGKADGGKEFFQNLEREVVTALVSGFASAGKSSFREMYELCTQGTRAVQRFMRDARDPKVRTLLDGFFGMRPEQQESTLKAIAGKLAMFDDERLDRATSAGGSPGEELDLEGLGMRPTFLYVGLPQNRIQDGSGQLLLQLVKRAIDAAIHKVAERNNGSLPQHLSFYLDEFANLGPLPNIDRDLATMRSRGVAYHVTLQNRAQGEAIYGPQIFKSLFSNNFATVLLFPRFLRFEDAFYFSEMLGKSRSVQIVQSKAHHGFLDTSYRDNPQEVVRGLLEPNEMQEFPADMGVLLLNGAPPVKVVTPRVDEKKAQGVKNPIYRAYEQLPTVKNADAVALRILEMRRSRARPTLRSQTPTDATKPRTAERAVPAPRHEQKRVTAPPPRPPVAARTHDVRRDGATSPEPRNVASRDDAALLRWFDAALESGDIRTFLAPDDETRVTAIEIPLSDDVDVHAFKKEGWIKKPASGKTRITGAGLELLGADRRARSVPFARPITTSSEATQQPERRGPNPTQAVRPVPDAAARGEPLPQRKAKKRNPVKRKKQDRDGPNGPSKDVSADAAKGEGSNDVRAPNPAAAVVAQEPRTLVTNDA